MTAAFQVSRTLCTLGPEGTDAEYAAKLLTEDVALFPTFRQAMDHAYEHDLFALVACGYLQKIDGQISDTWIDLNYTYATTMWIVHCFPLALKPLCFARRKTIQVPQSIVTHPSTEQFVRQYYPHLSIHYVDSKPQAVVATANGDYDLCVGSLDVVERYSNLEVLEVLQTQMVWAVYQRL